MGYLTDQELVDRFQFYTLQLEERLLDGEDCKTLIDQIPCTTILGRNKDIKIEYTNKRHLELTGYSLEEVRKEFPKYLESIVHPTSMKNIRKYLPEFYAKSNHQTTFFVQYGKLRGDTDYSPFITFTKAAKLPNGLVIRMPVGIEEFDKASSKIAQIVKMDEFKLKHFKQFQRLTKREKEILTLLAEGLNNPRIADRLFISRSTVETHRKHINRKLGIKRYRDVMEYAVAFDLIKM